MENKFKLKEGQLVSFAGSHYTNDNITDEKAIKLLKDRPIRISVFESFPDNWEESIRGKKERTPREKELFDLNKKELFDMCEELASKDEELICPKKNRKEAVLVSFIIDNER